MATAFIPKGEQTSAFMSGYKAGWGGKLKKCHNPFWLYQGCGKDRYDANMDWENGFEML